MFFSFTPNPVPPRGAYPDIRNFAYLVKYFLPAIIFHPQNCSIMADSEDCSSSSSSFLETPRRIDFEDAPPPTSTTATGTKNHSESMFVDKGRSLKALALLSLGLKRDNGSLVLNPSILPWSAAICKMALKMTACELKEEFLRHSVAAGNQ
jgi:hypothetical protein